jgi:hypothetical protein
LLLRQMDAGNGRKMLMKENRGGAPLRFAARTSFQ